MRPTLGTREGLKLEFKSAAILENPVAIAREAAAMLNSDGGEIWIGVEEADGVATRLEPIPDIESAKRALVDSLAVRLEPAPTHEEVRVEARDGLLVVVVAGGNRAPYAFLERSMRGYVVRFDARIRQLSREELRERFDRLRTPTEDGADLALATLRGPDRKVGNGAQSGLFVFEVPRPEVDLDLRSAALQRLLRSPEESGNRRLGWNFSGPFHQYETKGGKAVWRAEKAHELKLARRGDLAFFVPLDRLQWNGGPNEIYPWALAEFVVSVCRLYPLLVEQCAKAAPDDVLLAISLRGISGWTLRPYSPNAMGYELTPPGRADADIEPPALTVPFLELSEMPDRCGWRLLEQIYDHFGFGEAQMPPEFSRATHRLALPS